VQTKVNIQLILGLFNVTVPLSNSVKYFTEVDHARQVRRGLEEVVVACSK
jgi:hypothetical protein